MGFLSELDIPFEARNMTTDQAAREYVEEQTGQSKSPTVELDGDFLPDASVEDLAEALESRGVAV